VSEYRVFVTDSRIVGIRYYAGDRDVEIDENVAIKAVQLMEQSGEGMAGYVLDLGVLKSGETAVVEWNDGFALGSYGLDRAVYTDLLIARWCELVGCKG
jgi:hypothetical protein